MNNLEYFINERTKVLRIIKDNTLDIEGKSVCPLSQIEIAKLVPCSKQKANQIINELIDENYIQMVRSKGRYSLTDEGEMVLRRLKI
ncbi:hypothetical protein [[Clostridium] fimetarium]|uniref:Uncharacterized protein n=1 Tax=[Clostridium] fimetarium TaxID=99656 RepID=A0A1I0MD61_9FIRM|nr:hypothetical protein [[Clostridium] fimetarium]SEV85321.1 hypothetical protein SAMN05421659_101349 [[Clostridium] fimetarium]